MLGSIAKGNAIVPAKVGVDVGVTRTRGKYLVSSSDPITGTDKKMGWHAVHVSANDVATSGIMPDCLSIVAMFPPKTKIEGIMTVVKEISRTAEKLGITVSGGHTEITPSLVKPIVVVTCFGSGNRFVTSAFAKAGDSILMTKTAGIEGTSILANLPKVKKSLSRRSLSKASAMIKSLSILPEARLAFGTGRIHAMHDVTEGGVIGAVFEMSISSGLGFELDAELVPVKPATKQVCNLLDIDPLKLIGSGALLIACPELSQSIVERVLRSNGIWCTRIGRFLSSKKTRVLLASSQRLQLTEASIQDELWPALAKHQG